MLKLRTEAPDFSAQTSDGVLFTLSRYRNEKHVVLFFYPKDFSPPCTRQACQFRDNYEVLRSFNCLLIGISYDPPEKHAIFIRTHGLPYPLISDIDKSIARLYDVMRLGGYLPFIKRVTYVIDMNGIIRNVIHREYNILNHIELVKQTLRDLEAERGHTV
jgi:thioredoxin-dependent peroxiredoxin